jgi:hypothetical protein
MRNAMFVFAVLAAALSTAAQERPTRAYPTMPSPLMPLIDRMEPDIQRDAATLQRDAYIAAQIVAATGNLKDFQRNAAVMKAHDRIDAALKRAYESKPPPSVSTMEVLNDVKELIEHARQQGATADLDALQHDILKKSGVLQEQLFRELDAARKQHQMLTDAISRLSRINDLLDNAMTDALGSTFDYFRAGAK